jgi:hypothetical protein
LLSLRAPKSDTAVRKAMLAKVGFAGGCGDDAPKMRPRFRLQFFQKTSPINIPDAQKKDFPVDLNFNGKFLRRQTSGF